MVTLEVTSEAYGFAGFKITHTCNPNQQTIIVSLGSANMTCDTDALLTEPHCTTHLNVYLQQNGPDYLVCSRDPFVEKVGQDLYEAVRDGIMNQPLFVESLCVSLWLHMNGRQVKGKLAPWQLVTVSKYIHSRLNQNISLKDLCALVNLSRFHFTRLFKGTLGTTPHQYILKSKVEYAKTFMTNRKGSILDAAYQLSFSDHAHFTNTFRKITGITPKSYLKIEHVGT